MLFVFREIVFEMGVQPIRRLSISGQVDSGGVLVVRGPSGSGKSTLLRILSRLRDCEGGEVFLKGEDWRRIPVTYWRSAVHYLAQRPVLFDGTIADNLSRPFEARIHSKSRFDPEKARDILTSLMVDPGLWNQDARTVSGGEAARVAFARSILIDPVVLILDEPTSSLDDFSQKAFYSVLSAWLKSPEKAAILVTHNNAYNYLPKVSFLDIDSNSGGDQ
ncbi:MAG: ABC transporter ATP-binding protein [Bacillota bacterium]